MHKFSPCLRVELHTEEELGVAGSRAGSSSFSGMRLILRWRVCSGMTLSKASPPLQPVYKRMRYLSQAVWQLAPHCIMKVLVSDFVS